MTWSTLSAFDWDPTLRPFSELYRLQKEMNRLFSGYAERCAGFPAVNIWTGKDDAVVTAEVPGVDPKTINVTLKGNTLLLEGARPETGPSEGEVYHRRERGGGSFSRSIQLPFDADANAVKASYARGVLRVALPRAEATKPRTIKIDAH